MSSFNQAMTVFDSLNGGDRGIAQTLLQDLLDQSGLVRFRAVIDLDFQLQHFHQFSLIEKNQKFVLPGSWHLFYKQGCLLVRVKTGGTQMRPKPHMTISAVTGLSWNEEVMKMNRSGDFVPKAGGIPQLSREGNFRALQRVGDSTQQILDSDDRWANSCHFDFASGFDASGSANLS